MIEWLTGSALLAGAIGGFFKGSPSSVPIVSLYPFVGLAQVR